MKKLHLGFLAIAIMFGSCDKENPSFMSQSDQLVEETANTKPLEERTDLSAIASMLSNISINKDVCQEVHNAVNNAMYNGLEESYYFQEILGKSNKVTTRSGSISLLGALIKDYSSSTRSADADAVNLDLLAESDVQIYWPYSEDWDGETLPVITYAPENEDQEWNYAYRKNGDKIDTIIVNEEYMEKNPVWIVNNSDIAYEELPNFSQKQYTKNNVLFLSEASVNTKANKPSISTKSVGEPVYTVYLGRFMSEKQYDKIWNGGSEFVIQMGAIEHMVIESIEQLTSTNPRITVVKVSRSRRDIRKRRWAIMKSAVLSSDWQPNENNVAFMIHEEDLGGKKYWDPELSVNIGAKSFGFKAKIPYGNGDDLIYQNIYDRPFVFSTNNKRGNDWVEHESNGVYWTIPFEVGKTLY